MSPSEQFLGTIAGILVIGVLGEILFERAHIPDVLWLVGIGILLGPVSGAVDHEDLARIAPFFGSITLVMVLFDGGTRLRIEELAHAAPRSTLLAVLGFLASAGVVGAASMAAAKAGLLPGQWTWLHAALLGSILGGSSSIIIMPAMQQARLRPAVSNLVNLESTLTDAFCVVVTGAVIQVLLGGSPGTSEALGALVQSFLVGLGAGAATGLIWLVLHGFWAGSRHEYPLTVGALLALYILVGRAGGSAALSILTLGVCIGNAARIGAWLRLPSAPGLDPSVQHLHGTLTFIIKSFFFTFIGLSLGRSWTLLGFGALLGIVLLAARAPAVALSTAGSSLLKEENGLVLISLPRGLAAGVLATMPSEAGVPGTASLPVVVFACVISTILLFAVGFPLLKGRLARRQASPAAPPA